MDELSITAPSRPLLWSDVGADDALREAWPDMDKVVRLSSPLTRGAGADELREATFVIARAHPITAADFGCMERLVGVTSWGVGYNHVDLAAATAHGVPVAYNPVFTTSVAEAALTLVLALAKRLPQLMTAARAGSGDVTRGAGPERNTEVAGKTIAIVGYGRIGRQLGEYAAALGMQVVAVDPVIDTSVLPSFARAATLIEALPVADVLVLVLPLTQQTHHLIGAPELASMRPSACVINVGRGGLVDEAALLAALETRQLAGAGLDVWEREPPDPTDPLLSLPNVIGTAHALARTHESLQRICAQTVANAQAALAGRPMVDVLNPEVERRQP